jgi:hypothetical protein
VDRIVRSGFARKVSNPTAMAVTSGARRSGIPPNAAVQLYRGK